MRKAHESGQGYGPIFDPKNDALRPKNGLYLRAKILILNYLVWSDPDYADRYNDEDDIVIPKNRKPEGTYSPTCHFIVLVGYGINKLGEEYFTFYDPASKENGNSKYNTLIVNKVDNLIKGKRNNDTKQSYILTEFRLP